jgi:hypothetical protein
MDTCGAIWMLEFSLLEAGTPYDAAAAIVNGSEQLL